MRQGEQDARDLRTGVIWLEDGSYELRTPMGGPVASTEPDLEAAANNIHGYQHGRCPALMAWYDWLNRVARIKLLDHLERKKANVKDGPSL